MKFAAALVDRDVGRKQFLQRLPRIQEKLEEIIAMGNCASNSSRVSSTSSSCTTPSTVRCGPVEEVDKGSFFSRWFPCSKLMNSLGWKGEPRPGGTKKCSSLLCCCCACNSFKNRVEHDLDLDSAQYHREADIELNFEFNGDPEGYAGPSNDRSRGDFEVYMGPNEGQEHGPRTQETSFDDRSRGGFEVYTGPTQAQIHGPGTSLAGRESDVDPENPEEAEAHEPLLFDEPPTLEDVLSWGKSFDHLMRSTAGRKVFREFLRMEYSEENILFWLACEELKQESRPELIEEKARFIYEAFISILARKEVSLDSRVREVVNRNMVEPTPNTFDEAQLQIYTLMHRDSYPRFVNSKLYKSFVAIK